MADSRFIQSAKWMGGSKVRSSRGMAGFFLSFFVFQGTSPVQAFEAPDMAKRRTGTHSLNSLSCTALL